MYLTCIPLLIHRYVGEREAFVPDLVLFCCSSTSHYQQSETAIKHDQAETSSFRLISKNFPPITERAFIRTKQVDLSSLLYLTKVCGQPQPNSLLIITLFLPHRY